MREELYISNKKVDLGKSNISLNYKNTIFTDMAKMAKSYSYTIKLPKTQRNKSVFIHADSPAIADYLAMVRLKAKYLIDGVIIVEDADVYLLGATDDCFEISITWGASNHFINMVNNKVKLTDLKERWEYEQQGTSPYPDYHVIWTYGSISKYDSGDLFVPIVKNGMRWRDKEAYYMPAASAIWVLDRIAADNNLVFIIPEKQKEFLNRLFLSLTTRKDNEAYYYRHGFIITPIKYINGKEIKLYYKGKTRMANMYAKSTSEKIGEENFGKGFIAMCDHVKFKLRGKLTLTVASETEPNEACLNISYKDDQNEQIDVVSCAFSEMIEHRLNSYTLKWDMEEESDVIPYGKEITFSISGATAVSSMQAEDLHITMYCDLINPSGRVANDKNSGHYPIIPNLPDMLQIDYIKAIAAMTGMFAIPVEGTNIVKFMSMDDVLSSCSTAKDWSNRLVESANHRPKEIAFSMDGLSKKNWLRYKEDDKVEGNYDGYISSLSASLDDDNNLAELKFAGTDTKEGIAYIQLFTYDREGKQGMNKVQPRILEKVSDNGNAAGSFANLAFDNLIKRWYKGYKQVIEKPKLIKEKVLLSPPELKSLDMMKPIYLKQYGAHFLILSLKTGKNYLNDVELLKLD